MCCFPFTVNKIPVNADAGFVVFRWPISDKLNIKKMLLVLVFWLITSVISLLASL